MREIKAKLTEIRAQWGENEHIVCVCVCVCNTRVAHALHFAKV